MSDQDMEFCRQLDALRARLRQSGKYRLKHLGVLMLPDQCPRCGEPIGRDDRLDDYDMDGDEVDTMLSQLSYALRHGWLP